jgi:ribosomal-protein-alanine N-acetyltransferase
MNTHPDVSVRPAVAADLDAVAAIEAAAFTTPWTRDRLLAELAGGAGRLTVAVAGGQVVGHCLVWVVLDEVEILTIAAGPGVRRRGVGGALLDRLLADARAAAASVVHLEVRPSNAAALGLYTSRGFTAAGRRPGYYADGEDALVMRCELMGRAPR